MKYPTIRVMFDRRKNASETQKGSIEIEVCYKRKRKWFATGVQVFPHQWDPQKKVVRHPNSVQLNMRIEAVRKPFDDYINIMMTHNYVFTFEGLSTALETKKHGQLFTEYVKNTIESRKDIKTLTRRNHRRLNKVLKDFGRIKGFEDLTSQRIRDFDNWLHEQGYVQTTVAFYHKLMKNYIHHAMADDIISKDPYNGIRIEKGKHKQRQFLTEEEIKAIRNFESEDFSVMRARDLFLFQCFTGLAYADMAKFDFENVIQRKGRYVIRDIRQKSEEDFYIVLLPPALEILKKYGFRLPVISNQKYNAALKFVAAGAGIKRKVTSHMGRHTFATFCLNKGVNIETLAVMMGHCNIKATQIYAKMVNKTVESAFDDLEKKLTTVS